MIDAIARLDPFLQAVLAGIFTWAVTALGAAIVLVRRDFPAGALDAMLGFAAGVMIAASVWSLLIPAIELAEATGVPAWLPASVGLVFGAGFLRIVDEFLPHLHLFQPTERAEGLTTTWRRTTLLVLAITLHNIPEGLAMGVAFGASGVLEGAAAESALTGAIVLALGIGLQNFPEGIAVAMPLRREGVSSFQSFWFGQLSALVEPLAAWIGAAAVLRVQAMLPYSLAFAAGAMIYVVVEQLIPESQQRGRTDLATSATILGFTVMMILDVALS